MIPQADLRFLISFSARHVGPGADMLDPRPRGQAGVLSGKDKSQLERSARRQVTKGRYAAALPLHRARFFFFLALPGSGSLCSKAERAFPPWLGGRRAPNFLHLCCAKNLNVVALTAGRFCWLCLGSGIMGDARGAVGELWRWCGAGCALIRQCGQEVAQTSLLRSGGMTELSRGGVGFWERVWRVKLKTSL